ncbi:TIGR02206 family membrane protein [Paenibacillus sp. FA6]|uniref:YwaF family protein n=1 Tax=Paenibacillus sp. FA6 TaxID=3413029 RepID=UPI003F6594FD
MSSFFSSDNTHTFHAYTTAHLIQLSILIALSLLLFTFRTSIKREPSIKKMIRYLIAGILIASEVALNIWYVAQGIWNPRTSLPLELCSITLLLAIIMLFTRSRLLYSIVFFAGITGALQAVLTPSLDFTYPHFRFLQFFAAHFAIILSALYMTWIEEYKPTWKSIGTAMISLNILAIIVGFINYIIGSNYMFLMHKPATASILDILGPHPYYLLSEQGVALLFFTLLHLLFFVLPDRWKRRSIRRRRRMKANSQI